MPLQLHMLLSSLAGAMIVWRALRTRRTGWFGRSFEREDRPVVYWLTIAFGALLFAAGLQYSRIFQ